MGLSVWRLLILCRPCCQGTVGSLFFFLWLSSGELMDMLDTSPGRRGPGQGISETWFFVNSPVPSVTADSRIAKACLAYCCVLVPLPAGVRNLTSINRFIILKNGPEPILFVQLQSISLSLWVMARSICVKSLDGQPAPWVKMGYTISGPRPLHWKLAGTLRRENSST